MKRKITELEQKLLDNGWNLTNKVYTGKHSEKTDYYEYRKIADLRNEGKEYEQIIKLDLKRSKIVSFGVGNVNIYYLNDDELLFIRTLYFQLSHFVNLISKPKKEESTTIFDAYDNYNIEEKKPMTFEELDELNGERQ